MDIDQQTSMVGLSIGGVNLGTYPFREALSPGQQLDHIRWFRFTTYSYEMGDRYICLDNFLIVPEPASVLLLALGGLLGAYRRRHA